MKAKQCAICDRQIPEARLELQPNTLTCSKACSAAHTRRKRTEAQQAYRARQRAKRDAQRQGAGK